MITHTPAILDHDTLRRLAPSIFADSPWEGMSRRYRMLPTIEVVGMLADRGFRPVRAGQSRSRIAGKGDFTRHLIRSRHDGYLGHAAGAEVPELVLTNSHDGTSAYRFMSGIFRLVCSNGLVVQSADFGSVSVRHSGWSSPACGSPSLASPSPSSSPTGDCGGGTAPPGRMARRPSPASPRSNAAACWPMTA